MPESHVGIVQPGQDELRRSRRGTRGSSRAPLGVSARRLDVAVVDQPALFRQEEECADPPADVLGVAQVELREDRVDVALDAALRDLEALRDRMVGVAGGDQAEDLELAR